jgi:IS5 family transposase
VDTTLCETNIHYPTDSSLLWDSFRVLTTNIRLFKKQFPHIHIGNRFHNKKVKKLYSYISRNINNKSKGTKREVFKRYNLLIEQVQRAYEAAECCIDMMKRYSADIEPIEQLKHYLPIVKQVIYQADMRINKGAKLSAGEKIYSIFEEHTELIKRGKAGKPVEFGHMVMIAQTGEKFISDYSVMEMKVPDKDLVSPLLDNHKKKFGRFPEYLAGDKGFHESPEKTLELEEDVGMVCIPKKGMRTEIQKLKEHSKEFKEMQSFRAGSEGSISTLKRTFGMRRCLLRTFNTFAANIGCAAFCYNLVLLSKM